MNGASILENFVLLRQQNHVSVVISVKQSQTIENNSSPHRQTPPRPRQRQKVDHTTVCQRQETALHNNTSPHAPISDEQPCQTPRFNRPIGIVVCSHRHLTNSTARLFRKFHYNLFAVTTQTNTCCRK